MLVFFTAASEVGPHLQLCGAWVKAKPEPRPQEGAGAVLEPVGLRGRAGFLGGVGRFGVGHTELELRGPIGRSLQLLVITNTWRPACLQGLGRVPFVQADLSLCLLSLLHQPGCLSFLTFLAASSLPAFVSALSPSSRPPAPLPGWVILLFWR